MPILCKTATKKLKRRKGQRVDEGIVRERGISQNAIGASPRTAVDKDIESLDVRPAHEDANKVLPRSLREVIRLCYFVAGDAPR